VSLAKQGIPRRSLISFKFPMDCWLIDTGASDHMIGSIEVLSTFEPCSQGLTISMANDTIAIAQGRGTAYVAGLKLKLVLYVPNLKCNLLSMSKIIKEDKCLITFFHSYCEFQDLSLGKTMQC